MWSTLRTKLKLAATANFGGIDLVVDPYSSAKQATVEITMHAMHDLAVRHATAFNVISISAAP